MAFKQIRRVRQRSPFVKESEDLTKSDQNVSPSKLRQTVGGEASPAGCEEIPADELQEGDGQTEVHAGLLGRECGGGRGAGEDSQPHRGPGGQAAAEAQSGRGAGAAQGNQCPECRGHQECHRAHDGKQSVTEHRVTASSSSLLSSNLRDP